MMENRSLKRLCILLTFPVFYLFLRFLKFTFSFKRGFSASPLTDKIA